MQVNPLITVNIFIDPLQSTKTFTKKTIGQTHLHKEVQKQFAGAEGITKRVITNSQLM